jgi:hypothetical protein
MLATSASVKDLIYIIQSTTHGVMTGFSSLMATRMRVAELRASMVGVQASKTILVVPTPSPL